MGQRRDHFFAVGRERLNTRRAALCWVSPRRLLSDCPLRFSRVALLLAPLLVLVFLLGSSSSPANCVGGAPIVAGSEVGYPPFCTVNEKGQAEGFSVELMRAALAAVGRDVAFITGPWVQVRGWLENGTVQALPLVHRTPERERIFDFSFTYMTLHGVVVVRDDTAGINSLADLRGRDVAVMKGDSAEEYLRREDRGINLHTTVSFEEALRGLSEGLYDAVVMQHLVASRLIEKTGLSNLKIVGPPIEDYRQELCFAVREGNTELLALLNKGLGSVMADGTYRRLYSKWFGTFDTPVDRPIIVGGDSSFPPFEYLDDKGHPSGYNVDLTYAIAQALGLPVEVRLGPWAEMRQALQAGTVDVLQGMFYSPERDKLFDFTPAHLVTHAVAVARHNSGSPPSTLEELQAKRIAVQRRDIMHDWALEQGLGSQLVLTESPPGALEAVLDGRADCALMGRLVALYYIKNAGLEELVVGSTPLLTSEYCYAVREGRSALLAQFTEGLTLVKQSGEYRRIYEKWLGVYEEPKPSAGRILRYVAYVAGPLLVVLFLVLAWLWSLRRQVARRTEELRRSEEQLRQAQKMEALGRLAGGIAHDFNNLLTAILGYSELLLRNEESRPPQVREDLLEIRQAAERGSSLTRQILAFSRRQALRPEVVSLNEVLDGLTPMLRRTLGEDIELVTVKAPDLGWTEVDVHQLEQVIMNLAVNARDAMPFGGRLVLETGNVELDEEYSRLHPEVTPGRYVMLAISDTGVGMDKETLEHAFEPFFTTKEKGQGTGLGLAVAYGIVKQSRGHISAYSEPGKGATFRIYLPRVDAPPAAEKSAEETSPVPRGKEKIMVVEDEPGLRRLAERVLSQAGYQVVCYGTADEALASVNEGEQMDLLLTDVVLPGELQGRDLAAQLRKLGSRVPVLFMSGYSHDVAGHNGGLEEEAELLEKPFTPGALVRKVREILDRAKGTAAGQDG